VHYVDLNIFGFFLGGGMGRGLNLEIKCERF